MRNAATVQVVELTALSQHLGEGTKEKQENHTTAGVRAVNQGWDSTKNMNDNVLIARQPERRFYEWMVVNTSVFLKEEYNFTNNHVWPAVLRELIMMAMSSGQYSLRHGTNMHQQKKAASL
jgi:hypothetical protein